MGVRDIEERGSHKVGGWALIRDRVVQMSISLLLNSRCGGTGRESSVRRLVHIKTVESENLLALRSLHVSDRDGDGIVIFGH